MSLLNQRVSLFCVVRSQYYSTDQAPDAGKQRRSGCCDVSIVK
jgi:hypothetical protein